MSYAMRWKLLVEQPLGEDWESTLKWPATSNAPPLVELLDPSGSVETWSRCEEDMRELSAQWPALLLVLEVHNVEEAGLYEPNRWYFKAGKMQKVTAEYRWPECKPEKMD